MIPSLKRLAASVAAALVVFGWVLAVPLAADAGTAGSAGSPGNGGGGGGISGSAIWSLTWWEGTPLGPGPYTGGPAGAAGLCIWLDLGPTLSDLNSGLSQSSLPISFWTVPQSGGHPGIWGVDEWAIERLHAGRPTDHFDLVACPRPSQVPAGGGDIETSLPGAKPPSGKERWLWLFWDTVPDPPPGALPPIVHEAFSLTELPRPTPFTSPSRIGEVSDATVVNFPTWMWVDGHIWRSYAATSAGGGYVATVWALPEAVRWRASWDFSSPVSNPQGGVTFGPEELDQLCPGPGTAYNPSNGAAAQRSDCSFVFTKSTFGTRQALSASVEWSVHWALSSPSGVIGGEGDLGTVATTSSLPLRVMQVEAVITAG
ncbi:MAG: hypothetical protein M0Z69_02465 [Actinomycetota bacterium]|nr:hypothetical protein [Actinomycetota bacterium]